ncbi:hypothetical protein BDZ85DRAFT_31843 [Elsinoe ampelina]|uniref:DNA/RNA-binding protein Alba-like domain-containing protein n=1 Tax=Elsinoe ampelina TaxID=302913 RepID=A0A6A6G3F3_9PEZI|nr:hypothetical protein BDZ85DRAFT_31843 [Elsinoe ampelina]
MSIDPPLPDLEKTHSLLSLTILPSNPVSTRATSILKHLRSAPTSNKSKQPVLLRLTARASAANKLITIAEIVKRQLATEGVKVFQYSVLGRETVTLPNKTDVKVKVKGKRGAVGGEAEAELDEEEDGEAFEVMAGKEKVRSVPTLTIYLGLESAKELRKGFGEQTNMDEA